MKKALKQKLQGLKEFSSDEAAYALENSYFYELEISVAWSTWEWNCVTYVANTSDVYD